MSRMMRIVRSVGEMRSEIDELVDLRTNTVDGKPTYDVRPGIEDIGVAMDQYVSERTADGWSVKMRFYQPDLKNLQAMHDFNDVFTLYLIGQIVHSGGDEHEYRSTLKCVVFTGAKMRSLRPIEWTQRQGENGLHPVEFIVQERVEFMDRDLRYVS